MCVGCGNFLHRPQIVAKLIMKAKALPPVETLRERFTYNPETGEIVYRESRGCKKAGEGAGYIVPRGYLYIKIDGKSYKLHRIAWLMFYGEDPKEWEIDHIDRDKANNKISNLRLADRVSNCLNKGISKANTSGVTGVSYCKRDKLWIAKKSNRCLGYFKTKEEAIEARMRAM